MLRSVVVLALLLLATQAQAASTIYFATGYEHCYGPNPAPSPDTNYAGLAPVGSPLTIAGSTDATYGTKRCVRQYTDSVGGVAVYDRYNIGISSGITNLRAAVRRKMVGCTPGMNREILAFYDTGTEGCSLGARYVSTFGGVNYCELGAYYQGLNMAVCSGSTDNDRPCNSLTQCHYVNADEAQCKATTLATSDVIAEGSYFSATLTQDVSGGTYTCGLWSGAGGASPQIYNNGSGTRSIGTVQGYCPAGANSGAPCTNATECPSSTCLVLLGTLPSEIRVGILDTNPGPLTITDDAFIYYSGDIIPNWYIDALLPAGEGNVGNWASVGSAHSCGGAGAEWQCLNDGNASDGALSALDSANAAKPTAAITLGPPATPSTKPTPIAVILEAVAEDFEANGSTAATVRLGLKDDTGLNTTAAPFYFENFIGNGGSTSAYYLMPQVVFPAKSDSSAWNWAGLSTLAAEIRKCNGSTCTGNADSNEGRITTLVGEVLLQSPNPPIPGTIPDRNQDGFRTACFIGDSTWNNPDFQNAVIALLHQPDEVYFYTKGGAKFIDALLQFGSILDGSAGPFILRTIRRGVGGKKCDVVFLGSFVNAGGPYGVAAPSTDVAAPWAGVGQGGWCEDDGGAQQGHPCYCGKLSNETSMWGLTPAPNVTPAAAYCINHSAFKVVTTNTDITKQYLSCTCSTNADCVRGNDGTTGICSSGACVGQFFLYGANANSIARASFAESGCLHAPGCDTTDHGAAGLGGVCLAPEQIPNITDGLAGLQAIVDARATPNPAATPAGASGKPIVVYVISPPGIGAGGGWLFTKPAMDAYRHILKTWAKAHGYPFIDMYGRFLKAGCSMHAESDKCTVSGACTALEDATKCFRDDVHHTYRGQALIMAPAIAECATNNVSSVALTHDGQCTGGTCTRGMIGDFCSTDAKCDTWSCDLMAQP